MPVKGLIPRFTVLGKIKIGEKEEEKSLSVNQKEYQKSKKLDYFKLTTNEINEFNNFVEDIELTENLMKNFPDLQKNKDGKLTEIPIKLLYNDPDLNMPTRYACYMGKTQCICTGDGERAKTQDGRSVDCPCQRLDEGYKGQDKCKLNGTLSCVILGMDSFGGCYEFRTTGYNSCAQILGVMNGVLLKTRGLLAEIPLFLVLKAKQMHGKTGYVGGLLYKGTIEDLRMEAAKIANAELEYINNIQGFEPMPETHIKQVEFVSPEDEKQFANEFYPNQVEKTEIKETDKVSEMSKKGIEKKEPIAETPKQPEPFGGRKQEIIALYNNVVIEDVKEWKHFFNENKLEIDESEIRKVCLSSGFDDPASWEKLLVDLKLQYEEILPLLQFEITKKTGRSRWNDALKILGIGKAADLTAGNVKTFIRQIDDIPF